MDQQRSQSGMINADVVNFEILISFPPVFFNMRSPFFLLVTLRRGLLTSSYSVFTWKRFPFQIRTRNLFSSVSFWFETLTLSSYFWEVQPLLIDDFHAFLGSLEVVNVINSLGFLCPFHLHQKFPCMLSW